MLKMPSKSLLPLNNNHNRPFYHRTWLLAVFYNFFDKPQITTVFVGMFVFEEHELHNKNSSD